MISNDAFTTIRALDLNPIKVKLMHVESGEGWSLEHANAVELEYRRFLYLMKMYPSEQLAPLLDVDTFWHYHILDTMKYAVDCEQVFGYFLHHFPYLGMRGAADAEAHRASAERMRLVYQESFGASFGASARSGAAFCASPEAGAAFCANRDASAAFCARPAIKAAFCASPDARTAFCASPDVGRAAAPFQGLAHLCAERL